MYSNLTGIYDTGSNGSSVNPVDGLPENKLLIVKNNAITTARNMNVVDNKLTIDRMIVNNDLSTNTLNVVHNTSNDIQATTINTNTLSTIDCITETVETKVLTVENITYSQQGDNNFIQLPNSKINGFLETTEYIKTKEANVEYMNVGGVLNINSMNVDGVINVGNLRERTDGQGIYLCSDLKTDSKITTPKLISNRIENLSTGVMFQLPMTHCADGLFSDSCFNVGSSNMNGYEVSTPNLITDKITVKTLTNMLQLPSCNVNGKLVINGDLQFTGNLIGKLPITPVDFTNITTDIKTSTGKLTLGNDGLVIQPRDKYGLQITSPNNVVGGTPASLYVDGRVDTLGVNARDSIQSGGNMTCNGAMTITGAGGLNVGNNYNSAYGSINLTNGNISMPNGTLTAKVLNIPSLTVPAITMGTSVLNGGSALTGNYLNLNTNMNTTGFHKICGNLAYADTTLKPNQFQLGLINGIPGICWVDNSGTKHSIQFWNSALPSSTIHNASIANNSIYWNV